MGVAHCQACEQTVERIKSVTDETIGFDYNGETRCLKYWEVNCPLCGRTLESGESDHAYDDTLVRTSEERKPPVPGPRRTVESSDVGPPAAASALMSQELASQSDSRVGQDATALAPASKKVARQREEAPACITLVLVLSALALAALAWLWTWWSFVTADP